MSELASVGLLYDIVGVAVLGWALAVAPDSVLRAQAGTYWDSNPPMLHALVWQRIDARFGLVLLIVGFALQFCGTLQIDAPPAVDWSVGALLPITWAAYLLARGRLARRDIARIEKQLEIQDDGI